MIEFVGVEVVLAVAVVIEKTTPQEQGKEKEAMHSPKLYTVSLYPSGKNVSFRNG